MRKRKSPGADDIPAEFWKASGEEGAELLWQLCTKICWEEEWPKEWCRAVFVPLPKKGNLKECSNYRTISLISLASKIMLRIIINRMKLLEEISIRQAGFREGRGTRDQIVNIINIIEKCNEHRMPLYLCFIDYSKAFNCISHNAMWMIMTKMGFPKHLTDLVSIYMKTKNLLLKLELATQIGSALTGGIQSESLFNVYSENIMRKTLHGFEGKVRFGGERISDLRYADNTTLIMSRWTFFVV